MTNKKLFAVFVVIFLLPTSLVAKDKEFAVIRKQKSVFINSDCKKNQTCNLKSVKYVVERYKDGADNDALYGTRFLALYETNSITALEDYVFVQFVRGCRYNSRMRDGKIETMLDSTIRLAGGNGKYVKFCFPNWMVDNGGGEDPSYCSADGSRHSCRWKNNMGENLFEEKGTKLYGKERPKSPRLYMVDDPSGAIADEIDVMSNSLEISSDVTAINTLMEFKTCVYKASDVPRKISPYETDFAKPIHCYNWSSIFVYDHKKGIFREPKDAVPRCQEILKLNPPR